MRSRSVERGKVDAQTICFWILVGLIAMCVAAGGSSRADAAALLAMRAVVVFCLAAFLLVPGQHDWRTSTIPLTLLGGLALSIAVQLLPLPHGVWAGLPGRSAFASAMELAGQDGGWLTISLTADRTWNSLLALLVPLTVLTGIAAMGRDKLSALVPVLIIVSIANAIMGIGQVSTGPNSPLYLYEFTNRGVATGFFANRNHLAVLCAITIPLLRVWTLMPGGNARQARTREFVALALTGLMIVVILVAGSRSGLILACIALPVSIAIHPRMPAIGLGRRGRGVLIATAAAAFAGLVALAISIGRASAVDRLLGNAFAEDLRITNVPTLLNMVWDMFPFGAGFGSFDPVYRSYELDSALSLHYFNNAHNDLLELAITGGLPALLVLAAFLLWLARSTLVAFSRNGAAGSRQFMARGAIIALVMLLLASLSDYPLRTPVLGAIFALLCVWVAQGGDRSRREADRAVAQAPFRG